VVQAKLRRVREVSRKKVKRRKDDEESTSKVMGGCRDRSVGAPGGKRCRGVLLLSRDIGVERKGPYQKGTKASSGRFMVSMGCV
jgi:hypothetical protein